MPDSPKPAPIATLLGESRWRILGELCRMPQTASEVADRVGTSANAVRVHLAVLEEAGLVRYAVERRQVGKPTHVYSLTEDGESVLSKAYAPTLSLILSTARARLNGGLMPLLREAGVALGRSVSGKRGVGAAERMLEDLGAQVQREHSKGTTTLRASCCPLASITRESPEMCRMMEAAVETASGMKTREQCVRGAHPRCHFELGA